MAVSLSTAAQTKFFRDTFGDAWTEENVTPLIKAGVTLSVEFNGIRAIHGNSDYKVSLPCNTSALMKGTASPAYLQDAKMLVAEFISNVNSAINGGGFEGSMLADAKAKAEALKAEAIKHVAMTGGGGVPPVAWVNLPAQGGAGGGGGSGVESAKAPLHHEFKHHEFKISFVDPTTGQKMTAQGVSPGELDATFNKPTVDLGEIQPPKPAPVKKVPKKSVAETVIDQLMELKQADAAPKAKPVAGLVMLRDAKAVGQKVYGTSTDSVYTVIGLNSRVKVAARIVGNQVSIRAEFKNALSSEKFAIKNQGLQGKNGINGEYWSLHVGTGEVPPNRFLGAFLFDCGINFDDIIKSPKEVQG
jgi:hypothetical protein